MIALIPIFPLLGFLINGCWYAFFQAPEGRAKAGSTVTGVIATVSIFASFIVSLILFIQLTGMDESHRVIEQTLYSWISVGKFNIDVAFRIDALSTIFTLVVTGVGTLIHFYSIGYMSHDPAPGKFFAYLNLFCFAMLMLVTGASLPILFLGWEGVGLCSYLLIGFWYQDMGNAKAGKKAFIVNRIGDFGFLLGMFLIFSTFGTLDFAALQAGVAAHAAAVPTATITAICLLLFVGCMGKSAQIPLYVWLPDAMAGPTPVSALIHAATMVTSGIYLVSRLNFLYSLSADAMKFMAVIGVFTAFFAATIAITQNDIKKILAYSTISQLGYMFLGCGVGAYSAGIFHVVTHAFFKALLFLGAGSVIHGMHQEQNIWKMGGLKKKMPKTFFTFAVAWLAICGIPPFAGFFSKDEILWRSFSSPQGSQALWALGMITAVLTAFYMTRLFYLTFLGEPRFDESHLGHHEGAVVHSISGAAPDLGSAHSSHGVHESPLTMTIPLMVLAVLSLVGGFIGIPHLSWIEKWLDPVIPVHEVVLNTDLTAGMEWTLLAVSVVGVVLGIFLAFKLYKNIPKVTELAKRYAPFHQLLENKWYIDEIYEAVFVRPGKAMFNFLWKGFDVNVIDRVVLGFGKASEWTGQTVRVIQTGSIQIYALMLLLGIIVSVGYLIYGMV